MPVSPARAAAFEILMRIETTDAYASELLHSARFAKLSAADHGLLTELVMGVSRWRSVLDSAIARYSTQQLSKLDREVLTALRTGVHQLLFLDRIPQHAAINESVELVKRARKKSAAGLVNAILRRIADSQISPRRGELEQNGFDFRSTHPLWLVERWERIYGPEATRRICEHDQSPPHTAVWIRDSYPNDKTVHDGIQLQTGRLLTRAAIVTAGDISRTAAFSQRELVIQDEASQLVALLVGTGKNILDCCAAPGGKTRIIAQQNPKATMVAMDLHPRRAKLLRSLVSESNVHVIAADARQMLLTKSFDRILVDAPCSGTGTLARNPETKWRLKPEDLLRLQAYQIEILTAAIKNLSTAGRIVYSTCSLEPEENEHVIEKVMVADSSLRLVDCRDELLRLSDSGELAWKEIDSLLNGPYLRTIPGVHPCDGFFAAILQKH